MGRELPGVEDSLWVQSPVASEKAGATVQVTYVCSPWHLGMERVSWSQELHGPCTVPGRTGWNWVSGLGE